MNYFAHATAAERYAMARPYFHPKTVQLLLEFTKQTHFAKVLDVACGTGMGTKALLEVADKVIGIDAAPEMLEWARKTVPQAEFMPSQAEVLDFADSSFDLLSTFLAFHWFDGQRFLKEAARVLQAKGYLVIVQHYFLSTLEEHPSFKSVMNEFYTAYPQPPRNPLRLEPTQAVNHDFVLLGQSTWTETFSMSALEVAQYISTQSNIIAQVEQGLGNLERILEDITTRADEFLQGSKGDFGFRGELWVLQKSD